MNSTKHLLASLALASCIQNPTINPESKMSPSQHIFLEEKTQAPGCPEGMAGINNQFCIDRYEASIIDKNTIEYASPHYIPTQEGIHDADWQFTIFSDKGIDQKLLPGLIQEGQPLAMPVRGAEQYPTFQPLAVSVPEKIPASYVTKTIAEQACDNAGKRLCTRKEWYQACVGPNGPSPYFNEKKEEIFPENRPYGKSYQKDKCNIGLQTDRWPPGILGRKNNGEMLDPRISALLGKDGKTMKRSTGSFPECTNGYDVYDMLGNVHEIVSDTRVAARFPKERVTYVGSHYARSTTESCAEATKDHWKSYSDYSIGFRCCMNIQH